MDTAGPQRPDRIPEDMPDRMPDRISEDMSDRMPEDLPVRKYINAMMGITQNKIISLINIFIINYFSLYIIYNWENIIYSITDGRGFDVKFILIFCILLHLFI